MTSRYTRREFSKIALASCATASATSELSVAEAAEVNWLSEVQQRPQRVPADAPRLKPLLVDSRGNKLSTMPEWVAQRKQLRSWWLDFLGPMPGQRVAAPKWDVIESQRAEGVIRQRIRYQVEPGIATEAYLLMPEKRVGRRPGVAVFHSTVDHSIRQPAGIQGKPEKFFGLKLAQRGCVTLSPRNYLWPTNDQIAAPGEADRFHQRHPQSKGMARMLHDSLVAVDILASLTEVNPDRIGSIGHSLGAKEVLYLAALDDRVKVTVSSEGGVGTTFSNWDAPWYLGQTIKSSEFTHEHHELLALAAPRPFLLIGGDSADGDQSWPFIEAALPVYEMYGRPARVGLFNHKQGHAVPPTAEKRIYEWFDAYL